MTTWPGDDIAAGKVGRGHLRASHADREQVIGTLKAAFVQGMLAKDEFDLRVGWTLASRTYAELATLTADIPPAPTPAPANPARRRPLARAAAGSGGCLVIAAAAVWGAGILDPGPPAPSPDHGWVPLMLVIALYAVLAALGLLIAGMRTSLKQRRSRRQLPPRPGPGGHAPDGERNGGPGRGPVPPGSRTGQARVGLRARKPWQHRPQISRAGRAPRGARPAPGAA